MASVIDVTMTLPTKKKTKIDKTTEEIDIYLRVIDFEAKESAERTTEQDSEAYFNACSEIRSLMAVIHECKHSDEVDIAKIRAACTEACSNVITLKKINRLIKFRLNAQRDDLSVEKQKLDSTNLQLQNLFYELAHVTSEWNKCRQYKSKDEGIELISIHDFMKHVPKEVCDQFTGLSDDDLKTDHSLHLLRLEHELKQRVELAELCAQLEQRKVALAADIVRKREQLDAMGPQLDAIIEASKPLQETLGLPIEKMRTECKLAGMLSDGLYMLYGSARSYNTVYETGIELKIIGDSELAKQYIEKQEQFSSSSHNQQTTSNPHLDTFDSDSDQDDSQPTINQVQQQPTAAALNNLNVPSSQSSASTSNNESGTTGTNEDSGGLSSTSSRNKRGRHHGSRKGGQDDVGNGNGKKEMIEAHPLSVLMTVNGAKSASNIPVVKISFTYRANLHLITVNCSVTPPSTITAQSAVHVLHGDQLLNELIGLDDNGTASPNPDTHFQLSRVGLGSFKSLISEVGYAYIWAQQMCGLEFPQKKYNTDLCVTSVETVINALKHRIKMRSKLAEQLNHLGNNRLPSLPAKLQMPKNTISSLSKFSGISFQTFCLENDQALVLLEAEIISQNSLYYKVNITRPKTSTTVQAHIIIDNNYPKKAPIFLLKIQKSGSNNSSVITANNNEDIRDLERAVNIECFEDVSSELHVQILSIQMYYLCAYFDVYLETDDANKNLDKNSIYFKNVGGRNRRRPFRFRKIGSGIFTQ